MRTQSLACGVAACLALFSVACTNSHATTATSDVKQGASTRVPGSGGDAGVVVPEPDDEAQFLFDDSVIRTVELTIAPDDLATIDSDPSAEQSVPATLRYDGEDVGDIGVRYKGSVGAFLRPCTAATMPGGQVHQPKVGKCSMKLEFDYTDDNQRWHGLKKLNLHAMGRDLSLMREHLGYGLYSQLGVASPRSAYARLIVNGELQGLYLALEEVDSRFDRAHFSEGGKGNLYKEIWPNYPNAMLYQKALEANKGDDTDVSRMVAMAQTLMSMPEHASDWLDPDYMMSYLAVDRLILNDDGAMHFYCIPEGHNPGPYGNHNYFWYEAQKAGRFWLVPWDLDGTLANEPRVQIDYDWTAQDDCMCHVLTGFPQRRASCDPLVHQLADFKDRYDAKVDALIAGLFSEDAINDKFDQWSALIADAVEEADGKGGAPKPEQWRQSVMELRDVIAHSRDTRGQWPDADHLPKNTDLPDAEGD